MNRQDTARAEGNNTVMAGWLASGGAVAAPAGADVQRCGAEADDGLQGGRYSTNPFSCIDGGLRAGSFTTNPFACADDGVQCGNITRGYGCIPPQADDGLTAGNASHYGCGI